MPRRHILMLREKKNKIVNNIIPDTIIILYRLPVRIHTCYLFKTEEMPHNGKNNVAAGVVRVNVQNKCMHFYYYIYMHNWLAIVMIELDAGCWWRWYASGREMGEELKKHHHRLHFKESAKHLVHTILYQQSMYNVYVWSSKHEKLDL